jgi:hypothetical protein
MYLRKASPRVFVLMLINVMFLEKSFEQPSADLLEMGPAAPRDVKATLRVENGGPCSGLATLVSGPYQAPLVFRPVAANPRSSARAQFRLQTRREKVRTDVYQKIT